MRKHLQAICVAALAAASAQAAEYKPLLEEGKSWIMARAKYENYQPNYSRMSVNGSRANGGTRMAEYVVQLECTVAEPVEVEGEQCRRIIVKELGSENALKNEIFSNYTGEYIFLEKEGVISIYIPTESKDCSNFLPILNFNCQRGDSLRLNPNEYYMNDNDRTYYYKYATDERAVTDATGEERREIIFDCDYASIVEGIGSSTSFAWQSCLGNGFRSSNGGIDYYLIECRKDGKTIFTNDDFAIPCRFGLQTVRTLTPGKSWTMARGDEEFTVSVDRDMLIRGVSCVVLKSSEGKEYIAAEESGRVYVFAEHFGPADPMDNAVLLSPYRKFQRRNWATGEYDTLDGNPYTWRGYGANELTVGGRTFTEYTFKEYFNAENADESGDVVASWVNGVGAPDSKSWAVVMPEDFEPLRMIDCRQDGEVIFTADDFTYQSSISEVTAPETARSGIYDLQGRRVANPSRGLYIVDGQKRLLR